MRLQVVKKSVVPLVKTELKIGGEFLQHSVKDITTNLHSLNTSEEKREKPSDRVIARSTVQYLSRAEKRQWERLSPRKKREFIRKAGRKNHSRQGLPFPAVREESKAYFNREQKRKSKISSNGSYRADRIENAVKSNLIRKKTTERVTEKTVEKTASVLGGTVSVGATVVIEKGMETARKFKESLQHNEIVLREERMEAENKERETRVILGKGIGVAVASVVAVIGNMLTTLLTTVITLLLPIILAVSIILSVVGFLAALFGSTATAKPNEGYFGAKYYWTEYETGKTDDSAFATVLGDGGRAFGIQFDYRYTLQGFLQYCYDADETKYSLFIPYLQVDKEELKGNQGLAAAWTQVFQSYKDDFIDKQKRFADERYYIPAEKKLEKAGIKIKDRSEVCKGAVFSFVFQGCRMGIVKAVNEAGITNESSDEEFIKKIYFYRRQEYPKFKSRYEKEEQTALGLLKGSEIVGNGFLANPCPEGEITSEFGPRPKPSENASDNHPGRDYGAPGGSPIYAAADGVVKIKSYNKISGNYVEIDHGGGLVTRYQHCTDIFIKKGDKVKKGDYIATVGSTGEATGPHLHFEVHENGVPVDPRKYL